MPFYEYECENCKFYTELLQKVTDAPLKKCPSCGKSSMKKLVSAPVFRLKGAGWYETDFKGDKENKRNLAVDKEPESASSEDSKPKPVSTDAKSTDSKSAESGSSDTKSSESKTVEKASPSKASLSRSSSSSKAGGSLKSSAARKPAASKSGASTKSKARSKAATRGRR